MKWIVTANTNDCCIYEYKLHSLKLLKEINHPESRLHNKEIGTDKPGRYKSGMTSRGAYSPRSEPKDVAINNFIKEIAAELNEAKNHNSYEQLVIIMPDQVEGLLVRNLNNNVKETIKNIIHKNMMHLSPKELEEFIIKN